MVACSPRTPACALLTGVQCLRAGIAVLAAERSLTWSPSHSVSADPHTGCSQDLEHACCGWRNARGLTPNLAALAGGADGLWRVRGLAAAGIWIQTGRPDLAGGPINTHA